MPSNCVETACLANQISHSEDSDFYLQDSDFASFIVTQPVDVQHFKLKDDKHSGNVQ